MRNSVCLTLVLCFGLAFATVPPSERQALVDFYTSLQGQNWARNLEWLTGDPCENGWDGLSCDKQNTTVEFLFRHQQNLNGTIPDSIGDLTHLQDLSLSFNPYLVGTLPPFYVGLESLTSLTLDYNGLTGSIPPNLGQAPNLNILYLTEQNLTGTIPDDLFGAPYQSLTISGPLLEGTLPDPFCKSPSSLRYFSLSQTQLSGTFPDCLDHFPLLTNFIVAQNSFSGTIPSTLTKLLKLNHLEIYENQLTGSLPEFASTDLFVVALNQNQLTGTIPDWVCDLSVFTGQQNQFQCPHPSCCGTNNIKCGVCQ